MNVSKPFCSHPFHLDIYKEIEIEERRVRVMMCYRKERDRNRREKSKRYDEV